jgi:hypothetical protein
MPLQSVDTALWKMKPKQSGAGHSEPSILVEVRPKAATAGNLGPSIPEKLGNRINEVGDSLKTICFQLAARLGDLSTSQPSGWGLNEIELRFSLDLEAEAGILITSSRASGGFEARLIWQRRSE